MNPFTPQTISEQLMLATIRIETITQGNTGFGTGFWFNFEQDGRTYPTIITNAHVVEKADQIRIQLHQGSKNESGAWVISDGRLIMPMEANQWVRHPDSEIDLAAFLYEVFEPAEWKETGKGPFMYSMSFANIASDEVLAQACSAAEDVLMFCCPDGIWDDYNNLPIMRKGLTATHAAFDYMGKPNGVVDMACLPGCSGSPVVLISEGGATRLKSGGVIFEAQRLLLLGILTEAVQPPPGLSAEQYRHLGLYIKAKELHGLRDDVIRATSTPRENKEGHAGLIWTLPASGPLW